MFRRGYYNSYYLTIVRLWRTLTLKQLRGITMLKSECTEKPTWKQITDPMLGMIIALMVMITNSPTASANGDFTISGKGTVTQVIDGDTARIAPHSMELLYALKAQAQRAQDDYQRKLDIDRIYNTNARTPTILVRLTNIDTAESVHPDATRNSAAGIKASEYAKGKFEGKNALLTCHTIGYYGRPICNIITADGDWGDIMIRAGFTKYVTKYGRHHDRKWHEAYRRAEAETFN